MGHYNKSLAQKPTLLLAKVVTGAECYIKYKEGNFEKKAWDVNKRVLNVEGSHHHRNSNYNFPIKDKITFKRVGKIVESFTHLNTGYEQV